MADRRRTLERIRRAQAVTRPARDALFCNFVDILKYLLRAAAR